MMGAGGATTFAILWLTSIVGAHAQEGLATSSTLMGRNTIQQAPSGGRTRGVPGNDRQDRAIQGWPTPQERKVEQRNDAFTTICKGC